MSDFFWFSTGPRRLRLWKNSDSIHLTGRDAFLENVYCH